jgi:hypothetical protein
MENPFIPNISYTIEDPFKPLEVGTGGFNSGVTLENYIKDPNFNTVDKRKTKHNLNSQRLYRQRNRGEYKDIDTEAADITTFQSFEKAKDFIAKGGSIDTIKKKYELADNVAVALQSL